jgi:hypothetical protein
MARSQWTLGHEHVAWKLLMNCQHKSNQERIDPVGSPMSHALENDDRQIDK